MLYHIGGVVVLLPFLGVSSLSALSSYQILLLLASGVLLTLAALLEIYVMRRIDASAGEIFPTLTFIVSVAAGFLMFHEECSMPKALGALVIVAGIVFEARRTVLKATHGFICTLGSAALIAASMVVTKCLTDTTPPEIIILSGFAIPGIVYLIPGWRDVVEIPATNRKSKGLIFTVPVFDVMSYAFGIKALAIGELSTISMIFQATTRT